MAKLLSELFLESAVAETKFQVSSMLKSLSSVPQLI